MLEKTVLCEKKNKELECLKHDIELEILNNSKSIDAEFHDREDLLYKHSAGELRRLPFRLEFLNVRGGEF